MRELLNLNFKQGYEVRLRVLTIILLRPAGLSSSEQFLQSMWVSSFQRGRRLCDSARHSPSKALRCVTLIITTTSLIQICITRIYLNFFIVLRPSSDFIRIFMCAGFGIDLISVLIIYASLVQRCEQPTRCNNIFVY